MTDEITWTSGDVGSPRQERHIDWRETAKMLFFLADEFIIAVIVLYVLYRIFW